MVSEDRIREDGMTTEDVLEYETETPQTEVEILPEWEEWPEEKPGENTRIEDDELVWERDGFEARVSNIGPTKWRARVDVPEEYGHVAAREIDIKCQPLVEYGYVEDAEIVDYALSAVTLVLAENYQPIYEVNKAIDTIIEDAEAATEFQNELNNKLSAARENED